MYSVAALGGGGGGGGGGVGTEAVLDPPPPQAVTTALNSTARLRWAISLDMVLTRLQEMGRNGIAIASERILLDNKAGCRAMVRQQWIFACCRMNPTAMLRDDALACVSLNRCFSQVVRCVT